MTPQEEFAAKRREAEQLIREHAPTRLQSQLIALLRPAIALTATRTHDAQIPLGASKFGGAPDVPSDFVWPMWNEKPLGFLAQINLEEVAAFDIENYLPKNGWLSFFFFPYDFGYAENDASMRGSWSVFHFPQVQQRSILPLELNGPQAEKLHSCAVQLEAEWTTTAGEELGSKSEKIEFEQQMEEIEQLHDVFFAAFNRAQPRHRLLGWLDPVQGEVEEQCAQYAGQLDGGNETESLSIIRGWRLLLQVDADHEGIGPEWGDGGTNFYMIRQQDLASKNFQDVWFISECG